MLDQEKADKLSATPKVINEDLQWRPERSGRYRLRAHVLAPLVKEVLELWGVIGKTNFSFTLLFEQLPIRRYDNSARHTTPDGEVITVPHKHTWDNVREDAPVYIPEEIDPNADLNEQLLQFLEEENIRLAGAYQRLMLGTE
jgi:hypothetical protein